MAEQFYFAWVDPGVEFDPEVHNVMDEDVFGFQLIQEEGDFAVLSLEIKNPRIGLLNPGRKVWCWFAFDDGTTITPLFHGRLTGIPDNIFDTLVTLRFTARPADYAEQKYDLAQTLKVAPYWDPIFVSPDSWDDPDVVLESYSKLWHIDPVTHVVTTSDVLTGEDGTVEFTEDEHFYDALQVTMSSMPLRSVSMVATIPWIMTGQGTFELGDLIVSKWPSVISGQTPVPHLIDSFTLQGLISSWPKEGTRIGSGWTVRFGELTDQSFLSVPQMEIPFYYADGVPVPLPEGSIAYPPKITSKNWGGVDGAGFDTNVEQIYVPVGYGRPQLSVQYDANRKMGQVVAFTLKSSMQAIMTLPDESEDLLINLSGNNVSDLLEGEVPIGDVRRRGFVHSDRGQSAIQHLILIARANLVMRSRAVSISLQTDFKSGLPVTLRKGILVHDARLPGGQAAGKCTGYELTLDGSSGAALCTIKMASAIGYGGSHLADDGTPTYVEEGYVAVGYQEYDDAVVLIGTSDIAYTMPGQEYFDDGLDLNALTRRDVIEQLLITNSALTQRGVLAAQPPWEQAQVSAALQAMPTQISLRLVPMEGGPYQGIVNVGVSDLIIPKQIDLEAPSV